MIGISRNEGLAWQTVEDLKEEFPGAAISYKVGRHKATTVDDDGSACQHSWGCRQSVQLTVLHLALAPSWWSKLLHLVDSSGSVVTYVLLIALKTSVQVRQAMLP